MHSAKGLDFPVGEFVCPTSHMPDSTLDQATTDRMSRNLIMWAMTRAIDHLDVIMNETTKNPAVMDLRCRFEAVQSRLEVQGMNMEWTRHEACRHIQDTPGRYLQELRRLCPQLCRGAERAYIPGDFPRTR